MSLPGLLLLDYFHGSGASAAYIWSRSYRSSNQHKSQHKKMTSAPISPSSFRGIRTGNLLKSPLFTGLINFSPLRSDKWLVLYGHRLSFYTTLLFTALNTEIRRIKAVGMTKGKILVIDDEHQLRKALSRIIELDHVTPFVQSCSEWLNSLTMQVLVLTK